MRKTISIIIGEHSSLKEDPISAEFKERFLPFHSLLFAQRRQSISIYIFIFTYFYSRVPLRNVNGKSLCRKQSFCPTFQAATFVPLFLGLTVIRRYDDRYVNRCFADFRPGFSPHRIVPVSRELAVRAISTRRNERSSGRSQCSSQYAFPGELQIRPGAVSHSSPYVCLREIRPSRQLVFLA